MRRMRLKKKKRTKADQSWGRGRGREKKKKEKKEDPSEVIDTASDEGRCKLMSNQSVSSLFLFDRGVVLFSLLFSLIDVGVDGECMCCVCCVCQV